MQTNIRNIMAIALVIIGLVILAHAGSTAMEVKASPNSYQQQVQQTLDFIDNN